MCYTRLMELSPLIGLCVACRHVKVIKSSKGSFFIMCELAKTDKRFSKYPVLPVLYCPGFSQKHELEDGESSGSAG